MLSFFIDFEFSFYNSLRIFLKSYDNIFDLRANLFP